jgi:hypothetical protein
MQAMQDHTYLNAPAPREAGPLLECFAVACSASAGDEVFAKEPDRAPWSFCGASDSRGRMNAKAVMSMRRVCGSGFPLDQSPRPATPQAGAERW